MAIPTAQRPLSSLPPDLRVTIAPGVRVLGGGRLLVGGTPLRALSLTSRGARVVSGWKSLSAIGAGSGRQDLARRLMDAGMLELRPHAGPATDELTFVVPVRDRPGQLERCLRALARAAPDSSVVTVDDGSIVPVGVVRPPNDHSRVIRHPSPRGPAAARNTGLATSQTTFVGFVDSDVVLPEAAARRLLAHFADPAVAAVAPRVLALDARGPVAGYEARHSALDMGPNGGLVAPGRRVSYVPSAVLFVRRAAVGAGFDESLSIGEDVDLVWRLHAAGWRIRYAPEVGVLHEHPVRLTQLIARRYIYACSVGMLAARHPDALPAVWITPAAALAWALVLAGYPRSSAAVLTWSVVRTERRVRGLTPASRRLAAAVALRGLGHTGAGLSRAVRRAWSPPLVMIALRRPRVWSVLAAAFATRIVEDMLETHSPRATVTDVPLRILDEVIAAVGTWDGCVRGRTLRPLLPSFRPPRSAAS